jgi:hypothetical protein
MFVYDIDIYLMNHYFPNYEWVIKYKLFIFIGITIIIWAFTKNIKVVRWFLYLLFYPFILFFWTVPFLVFKSKSWTVALAVLNSGLVFYKSFKYNFFVIGITLISFCLLFHFKNVYVLYSVIGVLLIILTITYLGRLYSVFKPSHIYSMYLKLVNFLIKNSQKMTAMDEEIRNLPVASMNPTQLQRWTEKLQNIVLINRGCYFVASKLREYQKSNLNILIYIFHLIVLLLVTIIFFAAINFAVFQINPDAFTHSNIPSFFTFIYYSFNKIYFSSINEITPASSLSEAVSMIEILFSFFLVSIFLTLMFNVKSKKQTEELDSISGKLNEYGKQLDNTVQKDFGLSVIEAIQELERVKSAMLWLIYFFSKNLNKD